MTAQFPDTITYAEAEWTLAGVNGGPLFEPVVAGAKVRPASTACRRGFVCRYALRDCLFYLDDLHISSDGPAPRLFERDPEPPTSDLGFDASYLNLGTQVPFSGGLLLARRFIRARRCCPTRRCSG